VIGLDTNVLLRYLLRDDPAQAARADRELERGERFLIDSIVLCELVWVLEAGYGFSRTEITGALESVGVPRGGKARGQEVETFPGSPAGEGGSSRKAAPLGGLSGCRIRLGGGT